MDTLQLNKIEEAIEDFWLAYDELKEMVEDIPEISVTFKHNY